MANLRELQNYLNDDSFIRWIMGKAHEDESEKWEEWLRRDPVNRGILAEAKLLLDGVRRSEEKIQSPNPVIELKHFRQAIDRYETEEKQLWSFSKYRRSRTTFLYGAIAAGIMLLIGISVIFYSLLSHDNSNHQISSSVTSVHQFQTEYGQKSTLKLSDGSIIILNANSKLTFAPDVNGSGNVDIWLKGEAYFSIPHLEGPKKRVFKVHTNDGVITDLGTRFSVSSYQDCTVVALVKGQIRVSQNDSLSRKKENKEYLMKAGELAFFKKNGGNIQIRHGSTEMYTSWISDKLVYNHTPLQQVIRRIEETYGIHVVVTNKSLLERKVSGSLRNNSLDVLKKALSQALNVPIRQQGDKMYIGQ